MKAARTLLFLLAAATIAPAVAGSEQSVLTFHGEPSRSGNFLAPGLTFERARGLHIDPEFDAKVAGHIYAQPLYWRAPGTDSGVLFAETEENTVYALDAKSGKEIWSRALGKPVSRAMLACGNIDPLGITGTPVIDPAGEAIYLDAMVSTSEGPSHLVFGLSLKDGSVLPGFPVDLARALKAKGENFDARFQNERGALALLDGTLYLPFGGHFGDCGSYRGWIIGIPLKDPHSVESWATRAQGGGIWAPGGIASDGKSLYFATGNTFDTKVWRDGEAVFRLGPDLRRSLSAEDFFTPADWRALDARDADLGCSNPVMLDLPKEGGTQALVLAFGKDGRAFLLDRQNLGGAGGALLAGTAAKSPVLTAAAVYPADDGVFAVFQGRGAHCPARRGEKGNGLTALKIRAGSPPTMDTVWCADPGGEGSPIVTTTDGHSYPVVWIVGAEGDNRLHGFRGDTGEPLFEGGGSADKMTGLHHFQTLIAAGDRLYVAADGRIYAFAH